MVIIFYVRTIGNQYLKINGDYSIKLLVDPVKLEITLSNIEGRDGQIIITNESGFYYSISMVQIVIWGMINLHHALNLMKMIV